MPAPAPSDAPADRVDPRVTRTRVALADALEELIGQEPGAVAITISAVAERAGLSRQAMHAHYRGVGELLGEVVVRRLLRGMGLPATGISRTDRRTLAQALDSGGLEALLRQVNADRDFIRRVQASPEAGDVRALLVELFADRVSELIRASGATDDALTAAASRFVIGGMTHLVVGWLADGGAPSVEEQGRILHRFAAAVVADLPL